MIQGVFKDVRRWQRDDSKFSLEDGLLIVYCVVIWGVCVLLAGRTLLPSLSHSPMRRATIWCLIVITVWLALPPIQLFLRNSTTRSTLRWLASMASISVGVATIGFLYGIWTITHAPSLFWDYFREATLPASLLILLGVMGLMVPQVHLLRQKGAA